MIWLWVYYNIYIYILELWNSYVKTPGLEQKKTQCEHADPLAPRLRKQASTASLALQWCQRSVNPLLNQTFLRLFHHVSSHGYIV